MVKPVTMPQLGESVTEGTIVRWLKAEGDEVEADEPLCEVDTDKVNAEIPSPFAGKIERLMVSEGTTVDVGTEIVRMAVAGETGEGEEPAAEEAPAEEASEGEGVAAGASSREWPVAGSVAQPVTQPVTGGDGRGERTAPRVGGGAGGGNGRAAASAEELKLGRSSPVVRRLAAEHGVEISSIPGTGTGGRVTKKDIEGHVGARDEYFPPGVREEREAFAASPEPETASPREATSEAPAEHVAVHGGDRVVELSGIRRAIANRMSTSKREAPHAWSMVEVDVTALAALRARERGSFAEREGVRLTYLPFVVKAVAESLKEHPVLNSVWDGDRIVLRKRINIGVAVDLEEGALIVPVIKDADELNITGLARRIDDLVMRARGKRLDTGDVSGGTFTVNNPGALGSVVSTPIINHPQAAILSTEAAVKRPVVVEDPAGDAIAIRSMMNLEVSFDHRVLDGGAALRFLNAVKARLEDADGSDVV